jgi:hypothetical protein
MRVFGKKPFTKNYRVTKFSIFHDFSILPLITQRVFIAETCAWVRWKGILLSKIRNSKKKNQQQQLTKMFGFDDLKWNYSKCIFLKNSKRLPMNNNYLMYVCSKPESCL